MRTSVNSLAWTPEGRRCITGTQSGEFTLWNGTQFNFETIIQVDERLDTSVSSAPWLVVCWSFPIVNERSLAIDRFRSDCTGSTSYAQHKPSFVLHKPS